MSSAPPSGRQASSGPGSELAAAVASRGYGVVAGALGARDRLRAIEALEAVFSNEADIAADRGWASDVYRVSYALPAKDRRFVDLFSLPSVVDPARAVLGDDCVLAAANGLALPPGSPGQPMHRDHPFPTPGWTAYVHVVCALDAFTVDNGATRVVPGSHLLPVAERDPRALVDLAQAVALDAGDAICFDGVLAHAAGPNRTGEPRRALHAFFARPWVLPHWDFPATFTPEAASAMTEGERRLFGFSSGPRRFDLVAREVRR